ncbi:hypothetical protein ABPG72_009688 [Tetrahymena utriculariae]
MKFKATFVLILLILAVATSAKKSLSKDQHHDDHQDDHYDDDHHDDYHHDDDDHYFPDFKQIFEPVNPFGQALDHDDHHYFPDFEQIFEEFEEADEQPVDPVGQALFICIKTNYFPWDDDHKTFIHIVNDRCQHYGGNQNILQLFEQSINCVQNVTAPRESVKTQFIAALQCVAHKFNGQQGYHQDYHQDDDDHNLPDFKQIFEPVNPFGQALDHDAHHDFLDFEQIFEQFEETDEQPVDPFGQALFICIKTNYFPWDDDHKTFIHIVNDRCQHYDGNQNLLQLFEQSINCVQNVTAPRESVKTQFIAALQCVVDKFNDQQEYHQQLVQKKKAPLKSQHNLKRRRRI